ncbi:sulfatase-like hydrolase/transferase [Sharpea azabuensis]|uniref:sulfatase-like hydrolase/transferase n=1 Tax=Sharpea azabuensis TaxID=322505 RepID=UPI00051C0AAE|nr:sulfatase-like hydrolase/transferase [Sharpea azabuensis]
MNKKPNIFLFVADQMRADSMHHMNNEASITPNLDDILKDGISFENAYCQNPVCVPSRCSFLTGLYPHTTGHRTMHYLQRHDDEPNILKEMKNNGYEVIWIGRNDVVPGDKLKTKYCDEYYDGISMENTRDSFHAFNPGSPHKVTKEEMEDDKYYSFYIGKTQKNGYGQTDWNCVQSALDYLERKSKEPDGKPFFVYCTLAFPHPPYGCEDPWYSMIDRNKIAEPRPNISTLKKRASMLYGIESKQNLESWTKERFNELRATYLAMVSRFDYQFGQVVNKLKEKDMYDDTNIIVWSDHGDYTGDYGIVEKVQNCFENPISNVPLLIKPSSNFACVPRKTKALGMLLDIPATIAEMADIKLSYTQFGHSMMHVVAGDEKHNDAVFCEGGRIHGETQAMERGHSPKSPYWPRLSTQASEGPEHTKACMCRMGNLKYTMRLYEQDELYDLENDPLELNNLIDHPDYIEDINKFKERLLRFYMETTDFVPMGKDLR